MGSRAVPAWASFSHSLEVLDTNLESRGKARRRGYAVDEQRLHAGEGFLGLPDVLGVDLGVLLDGLTGLHPVDLDDTERSKGLDGHEGRAEGHGRDAGGELEGARRGGAHGEGETGVLNHGALHRLDELLGGHSLHNLLAAGVGGAGARGGEKGCGRDAGDQLAGGTAGR